MMKKLKIIFALFNSVVLLSWGAPQESTLKLWYDHPAQRWGEAFPLGNGRLAAMSFGGSDIEHFQINEESLWAGCQINPYASNFHENLKKVQQLVLSGEYAKAHDFGINNLTAKPTSFRSYEPFADLYIKFDETDTVSDYRRELDLSRGLSKVIYKRGGTVFFHESFISAVDDILCIRLYSPTKGKINCTITMSRFKDAKVSAYSDGRLNLDGQIVDIEAPMAYDDNPGGSGPGGKHMRFAGRLVCKISNGNLQVEQNNLVIKNAQEVVLIFTAATDYNLSLLNFDSSINPVKKCEDIIAKVQKKSWEELKNTHIKEHCEIFNRVNLNLGTFSNDSLPTDKRIKAFQNGSKDEGLIAQLFQFGRYLLMSSSRRPAILPANLQGKWSKEEWAPWEADYHLNVNLQMNYWPSCVTNLSEVNQPLIDWFGQIVKISRPFAKEMYNAKGFFCCLATNPFGRITPSASTIESQFNNGVLDPLAGAWMVMNLWDYYEYSQDLIFLKTKLLPMLKGASEFILDNLITDSEGILQFVPSTSPENAYKDPATGRIIRITSTSTYHLSIIRAVFKATLEALDILKIHDTVYKRIQKAEKLLPPFIVDKEGRLMEWRNDFEETEPGHRHLSHLLCIHPFSLLTSENNPELFEAAKKSLEWRKKNGQGSGGGWSAAYSSLMYAWFLDGENAYEGLERILDSLDGTLLNVQNIFQIDANFGATSCIAEMLIQSHKKDSNGNFIIHLLPAIPSEWQTGSFKGLCARGGFTVDMKWEKDKIKSIIIEAKNKSACKVRFKNTTIDLILNAGEKREISKFFIHS